MQYSFLGTCVFGMQGLLLVLRGSTTGTCRVRYSTCRTRTNSRYPKQAGAGPGWAGPGRETEQAEWRRIRYRTVPYEYSKDYCTVQSYSYMTVQSYSARDTAQLCKLPAWRPRVPYRVAWIACSAIPPG